MSPPKHKMSVLAQMFKLILRNSSPKLVNKHGADKQSRSFNLIGIKNRQYLEIMG
ncbi:MAG: hypothetical protein WC721_12320 [Victivallaceae bacterium]|jgi:hypothetical protein